MRRNPTPLTACLTNTLLVALTLTTCAAHVFARTYISHGKKLWARTASTRALPQNPEAQPQQPAAVGWRLKRTLRGHTGAVYSASFFPDGARVATSGDDGSIRIWDVLTGRELKKIDAAAGETVSDVAVSPDGTLIASCTDGDEGPKVQLWDSRTLRVVRTLQGHQGGVFEVIFSPDGRMVASGGRDKTVRLWDAATGTLLRTLKGHADAVTALAFTPDGRVLASAGAEGDDTVRLWDARTGRALHTLKGHKDWVTAVAFAPDGVRLASGSRDRNIIIWDARTGRKLRQLPQPEMVYEIGFSPDGKLMAEAGGGGLLRLHDAQTGRLLSTIRAHKEEVNDVKFSPRGALLLLSAGYDATVKLWEQTTPDIVKRPRAKWME
jgi:WD40 repeat protein